MAKKKASERAPDLREFIKENDQRLYDFCSLMLGGSGFSVDDLILSIFREFGDHYRSAGASASAEAVSAFRIELFSIAWERTQQALDRIRYTWTVGRDTRAMRNLEEDLLARRGQLDDEAVTERLSRVEPDFRAPIVLRDVLKFEDDEVLRILGLRWGVYRHRLHRGRLEFRDALRGHLAARPQESATAAAL